MASVEQTIEVDVHGRRVRTLGEPQIGRPGYNLVLGLDLELQGRGREIARHSLSFKVRVLIDS